MKIKQLLQEEGGENLETIVKIDNMPEFRVVNPSDEEKEEAQKDKKSSLPPEVTDNPAKETPKDATSAAKDLVIKLLDNIKEYLKSV